MDDLGSPLQYCSDPSESSFSLQCADRNLSGLSFYLTPATLGPLLKEAEDWGCSFFHASVAILACLPFCVSFIRGVLFDLDDPLGVVAASHHGGRLTSRTILFFVTSVAMLSRQLKEGKRWSILVGKGWILWVAIKQVYRQHFVPGHSLDQNGSFYTFRSWT